MFFNSKKDKNFDNKKYLLVIIAIMIVAAIGLSISSMINKDDVKETLLPIVNKATSTSSIKQSYLATSKPVLEDGDFVIGLKEAPVKIFVYEDYDNILSAKFDDTINRLITLKSENIAFIVRPFISSEKSAQNALAVVCAGDAGEWQLMRGMIFNTMLNKEKPEKEIEAGREVYYYAEKLELNPETFATCLTNHQKSGKIEQLVSSSDKYGVKGSPTVFIGDELILGARPFDDYVDSNGDSMEGLKTVIDKLASDN